MPPFQIIFAEDDPLNREVIVLQLTHLGLHVTACSNGQEVLDRCWSRDTSYDLVLLDIKMAGLDGIATAKSLRQHPKTRDVPILFITAGASTEEQAVAWSEKPTAVLIKPFTRAQLDQTITHALRVIGNVGQDDSNCAPATSS